MFLGNLLGPDLLIVVLVIVVLLFGGSFIPKFAKNLGSAKTEFEKGLKDAKTQEIDPVTGEAAPKAPDTKA